MEASQTTSSLDGNGEKSEQLAGEEQKPKPIAISRELQPDENARFHDCIKEGDWGKLKKMLKRYKPNYYIKKRIEVREREKALEEFKLQQEAQDTEEEGETNEEDKEELSRFQRITQYRPFKKKDSDKSKELKPPGDGKSVKMAKKVLPENVSKKIFVDPADIISPLLLVDSDGMTPLHIACIREAPEKLILELIDAEKKATTIKDKSNRLPLHYAIQTWQYDHIIERMVKGYPNGLKTKDDKGQTPLGLAVKLAREGKEVEEEDEERIVEDPDDPFLWISPTSPEEKDWQFQQLKTWAKVNCLLRELINRQRAVLPSEHGLILEALEGGADPNTIIRFISTTDRYLMLDDELAWTAIGLCVERHYKADTLEYLMENCRDRTTVITDVVQKVLKNHYLIGCYPLREGMVPFGKRVIDWSKKYDREERKRKKKEKKKKKKKVDESKKKSVRFQDESEEAEEDEDDKKKKWEGMKKACKDWWEILNHLLFYRAYGRDYKIHVKPKTFHLLHAALSVPMTSPSLVHLLLIVYPQAIKERCPFFKALPVHIASTRWRYNIIYDDVDISSLQQVLLLMYDLDPEQLHRRFKGSLPIHLALSSGQSWDFIKPQLDRNSNVLGMRDAHSKLYPFQIAALETSFKNIQLLMRCRFNPTLWREMSVIERKIQYQKIIDRHEKRQLTTIFELLRMYPNAIENIPICKTSSSMSQSLRSLTDLSKHYLSWVYGRSPKGEFRVRYNNLMLLRNSIIQAEVFPELQEWWEGLTECIWRDSHGDIPRENEYLLHAALYNCETPPIVTELLIQLFPSSTAQPIPGTSTFPLHIAAGTTAYHRQLFEIPYGMNNLLLVLKANKDATRIKSNGRLPLHICLARGKSWKEVQPLVMVYPYSLKIKDMQTGLVPAELRASFKLNTKENAAWTSSFTEKQMKTFNFHKLSAEDKAKALVRTRKRKETNTLTCIFELTRESVRTFGFTAHNDNDSVTSLNSFNHDGYEVEEDPAEWELNPEMYFAEKESVRNLLDSFRSNAKSLGSFNDIDPDLFPSDEQSKNWGGKESSAPARNLVRMGTKMSLYSSGDFSQLDLDSLSQDQ